MNDIINCPLHFGKIILMGGFGSYEPESCDNYPSQERLFFNVTIASILTLYSVVIQN
jgi:hypothetical protein